MAFPSNQNVDEQNTNAVWSVSWQLKPNREERVVSSIICGDKNPTIGKKYLGSQ